MLQRIRSCSEFLTDCRLLQQQAPLCYLMLFYSVPRLSTDWNFIKWRELLVKQPLSLVFMAEKKVWGTINQLKEGGPETDECLAPVYSSVK